MRSALRSALRLVTLLALATGCIDVELDASAIVSSTIAPSDEQEVFRFEAAQGAVLTLRLESSGTAPIDFGVVLLDDTQTQVGFEGVPGVADTPGAWSVSGFELPKSGRFGLVVSGDRGGDYRLQIKVGKGSKRVQRLDLRAVTLGLPAGEETAVSRTVQPAGGTVTVENDRDRLGHARVDVPAGALKRATRLTISSAATPAVPDAIHQRAAGPAMRIDPPLRLAAPATVGVRYRAQDLPVGTALSALRVLLVDSRRKSSVLVPSDVDAKWELLTVTTDRLGTFVPFVARGTPNLAGRKYWEAAFVLSLDQEPGGDSRRRGLQAMHGTRSFEAGSRMPFAVYQTTLEWTHDDLGRATLTADAAPLDGGEMIWTLSPDGRTVSVADSQAERYGLTVADDASVLVPFMTGGGGDASNWLGVSVEIDTVEPTSDYVAGTYWTAALLLHARKDWDTAPLMLEIGRQVGTVTIRPDGTWSSSVDSHAGRADGDGPARDAGGPEKSGGTWVFATSDGGREFAGSLRLLDAQGESVMGSGLRFGARGQVFVALNEPDSSGAPLVWAIGLRKQSGAGPAMLAGEYGAGTFEFGHTDYAVPERAVADVGTNMDSSTLVFASRRASVLPGAMRRLIRRDTGAPGGVFVDFETYDGHPAVPCSMQKTGKLTISPPGGKLVGAMTADCGFGFHVTPSASPTDPFGVTVFVRSPPAK